MVSWYFYLYTWYPTLYIVHCTFICRALSHIYLCCVMYNIHCSDSDQARIFRAFRPPSYIRISYLCFRPTNYQVKFYYITKPTLLQRKNVVVRFSDHEILTSGTQHPRTMSLKTLSKTLSHYLKLHDICMRAHRRRKGQNVDQAWKIDDCKGYHWSSYKVLWFIYFFKLCFHKISLKTDRQC